MLTPTDKSTLETVQAITWWTDALFCLSISRPAGYRFMPGQFSRLGLPSPAFAPDSPGAAPRRAPPPFDLVWRAYSITCAPDADHLEYYGIVVPGGAFTSAVRDIKPGDPILLEKAPNGFLTIDRFTGGDTLWMLATGTGLGPYVAILRDPAVWQRFQDLVLVHSVRHANEFAFADIIDAMARDRQQDTGAGRLHVVRSTTREANPALHAASAGPDQNPILHGRITTLLDNGSLEAAAGKPLDLASSRFMLCGNPAMIEEMRKLLQRRQFQPVRRAAPGHFLTENYW
jgi:ferredoxin--NADP+ reductase